jgi:NAD(P)-dependent dehydrogenase (short-subunit alcohol dehydrogenase family)
MGRKVVITGGLGYLGAAVAEAFARQGAEIALIARATGGSSAHLLMDGVDLADPDAARRACAEIRRALGKIDVLVNVAGGFDMEPGEGLAPDIWDKLYSANLKTCVNMCAAAIEHFAAGGAIVNVGAVAADNPGRGMGAYAASKSGVARLTQSLADTLGGRIRVNAVLPRTIDTPANRAAMPDADRSTWTSPAAIADAIAFLASDQARAMNGALLPVTNGA